MTNKLSELMLVCWSPSRFIQCDLGVAPHASMQPLCGMFPKWEREKRHISEAECERVSSDGWGAMLCSVVSHEVGNLWVETKNRQRSSRQTDKVIALLEPSKNTCMNAPWASRIDWAPQSRLLGGSAGSSPTGCALPLVITSANAAWLMVRQWSRFNNDGYSMTNAKAVDRMCEHHKLLFK